MIAAALFVTFAVLLLIGAPIAVCLGASSMLTMLIQGAGRPLDAVMSSLPMIGKYYGKSRNLRKAD